MRSWLAVFAALGLLLLSSIAWADEDTSKRAEQLYEEALALIRGGDFTNACKKLEESQKLDPALGTQFNLADCWERTGKLGTAHRLFVEVERAARAAGKSKLMSRAHERVTSLDPRVARIRIVLSEKAAAVVAQIDREAAPPPDWAGGISVNRGDHVVDVTGPGKEPWSRRVTIKDGEVITVAVALVATRVATLQRELPMRRDPIFRIAGASAAGLGLVGLGIGSVFGIVALDKRSEAREACGNPDPAQCGDEAGAPLWKDAKSAGNVSTIAFIAGAALVATGAVLWFTAPWRADTRVGMAGTSLRVEHRW